MARIELTIIPLLCFSLIGGCCHCPPAEAQKMVVTGPSEPTARVIAAINANNEKLPTLWSSLYYKANIIDEKKQAHFVNGEGTLTYRQPMDLRLLGRKDPAGVVFDIGSNRNQFWLRIIPQMDTMWWGTYENLSRVDPSQTGIPIRPDLVLGVLAIDPISTNPDVQPVATMRFNAAAHAYMFVWTARLPDRWIAVREVWYDQKTKRPRFVLLYDSNGRVVLRAELKQHKQVEAPNVPKDKWPWVASDYNLTFPDTGSTMEFTLSDDTVLRSENGFPKDASFLMPSPDKAGVSRVIEIGRREQ